MRRLPVPLLAILCVAGVQALAWSVLLPVFQGQDEVSHFAYTQRIAETGKPTWTALETLSGRSAYSSEVRTMLAEGGAEPLALNVSMRPYGTPLDEDRWRAAAVQVTDAGRANGGRTSAMRNPPLYYLYGAAVYTPFQGADLVTRQYVLRWASIPFFLIAVLAAWLLAGEVFGPRRWLQSVTALAVALHPMLAQIGGIFNPDALIAALFGLGLWLGAVIVNRGISRGRLVAAGLLAVGACLVHARAAPVVLVLGAALMVRAWPRFRAIVRSRMVAWAAVGGGLAVFASALTWYALRGEVTVARVREFASYLWQFYLPRPEFMKPSPAPDWGVREVFVDRLWSGFVQLEVNLAPGILEVISLMTMVAAGILLATLVLRRAAVRRRWGLAVVFGVAAIGLLATLHAAAWHELPYFGDPIITGRYLTPLLPLAGLALAAVVTSLPRLLGPGAATAVLGAQSLLALAALGTAVVRFHA